MSSSRKLIRGFTLIELLVVIAIIGLLSTIVVTSLVPVRRKARDAKRVSDVKSLELALEVYFDSNRIYPSALSDLAPTYLSAVPTDPLGQSYAYFRCNNDGSGGGSSSMGSGYLLAASLEESSNSALSSDSDFSPAGGTSGWCPGAGAPFSTTNPNPPTSSGTACSTSGGSGGDSCYDIKR